jgi:hypothetical protein
MNKFTLFAASYLLEKLMKLIGYSCRVNIVEGKEIFDKIVEEKKPVAYCFWHNRIFYLSYFLYRYSHRKGLKITALISQSKDGEIISRVVKAFGGRSARGSTTRGGIGAVKTLLRCVRDGYALAITPDGPRGPVYKFQSGAIFVSSFAQVPIVPITCTFEKAWVFKSWDKFMIPKPFSKINVYVEKPLWIEKEIKPEAAEKCQKNLENIMLKFPELISGSIFVDGEKNRV